MFNLTSPKRTIKLQIRRLYLLFLLCVPLWMITCCSSPVSEAAEVYVGHWESESGDYVTILPEGKGNLKKGLLCMRGARVNIGTDSITMGIWGKKETLRIESQPQDREEYWAMTLSGVEYKRFK